MGVWDKIWGYSNLRPRPRHCILLQSFCANLCQVLVHRGSSPHLVKLEVFVWALVCRVQWWQPGMSNVSASLLYKILKATAAFSIFSVAERIHTWNLGCISYLCLTSVNAGDLRWMTSTWPWCKGTVLSSRLQLEALHTRWQLEGLWCILQCRALFWLLFVRDSVL